MGHIPEAMVGQAAPHVAGAAGAKASSQSHSATSG